MKSVFFPLVFALLAGPVCNAARGERLPNVILIMADDLGYHDLSGYGHRSIKTPVLDRLAGEGVKLTSFYAGATVCTPSRMALLTGAYPARLGWTRGVVGYMMKKGEGLNPETLTMPELFRSAGYATGIFGKWHLGDEEPMRPHRQGFETTCYINKSNNQTKELWQGDHVITKPFTNRLLTELFTSRAIEFIDAHRENPFFLYLPYTAPHFPLEAHPEWKGRSQFGVYGDVVEEMDHRIGQVLEALNRHKLRDDTIVIFLSDNGPEPMTRESKADPFRGKKWSALEGGTRVPCFIRYPGVIPAKRETEALVSAMDLLPSLAHACGIDLGEESKGIPVIDGVNVWDTLTGKKGAPHAREDLLFWHGGHGFQAIRVGKWKLFMDRRHAGMKGARGPALFNLENDPGEKTDLSVKQPAQVKSMSDLAERRLAEMKKNMVALGRAE